MPRDWESAYREAILEADPDKLIAKIDRARTVISTSLLELDASQEHGSQRRRVMDALSTLDLIRRVELKLSA